MTYAKIVFVDNVTPLNALNMNKIDDGIYDNQSVGLKNQENVSDHFNAANKVHIYDNISTGIDNSSISFNATISTLKEEILTYRKHLKEIHGMTNWNDSSWYGTNISSHTIDINNLSEAVNVSIPNDMDNVSTQAFVTVPSNIDNLSTQTNTSLPYDIGSNTTDIQNLSSDVYDRIFSLTWNGSVNESQYLIGGDRVGALYQFNVTSTLIDSRINMKFNNASGNLKLIFNKSSGEILNWSSGFQNDSYYRETISLSDTIITTSDGISVQATNVSQLESLFMNINYKENY